MIFYYWEYFKPKEGVAAKKKESYFNVNTYSGHTQDELFIEKSKYANMKEEAINAGDSTCTIKAFNGQVTLRSNQYMKSKAIQKLRATYSIGVMDEQSKYYGIDEGSVISLQHVQSVILYTDFTGLSSSFSSSFREITVGESLESIKLRNQSFYYMSKYLRETVELFGDTGDNLNSGQREDGPFYCGMTRIMALQTFSIRLCGPLSTSKQKEVAIRFATTKGMVLELNNNADFFSGLYLKFFNCSLISLFKEEDERLFMGERLLCIYLLSL